VLFGKLGSPRVIGKPDELIVTPRREHSRKPDEFYDRAVEFAGYVPRVELFARQTRPGWTAIGDQASLFDGDAVPQAVARRGRRTA
jgi:N6-adenosine-specific RNA methylase IME4